MSKKKEPCACTSDVVSFLKQAEQTNIYNIMHVYFISHITFYSHTDAFKILHEKKQQLEVGV